MLPGENSKVTANIASDKESKADENFNDCPLVTLGLVLDGNGFPPSSQVFPGNASEPATLSLMLDGLQRKNPLAGEKPVIIMDAGIASADNIVWLSERGYLYLVVSRERGVQDPKDQDPAIPATCSLLYWPTIGCIPCAISSSNRASN